MSPIFCVVLFEMLIRVRNSENSLSKATRKRTCLSDVPPSRNTKYLHDMNDMDYTRLRGARLAAEA